MSLAYIMGMVSAELGFHPDTVPEDRTYLTNKFNQSAKELHERMDLVNCTREQLVAIDATIQQISLPATVFQLRGVRNYATRRQLTLHDMRPRYQTSGWTEPLLTWRDKYRSPISREIANQAPLTLTIGTAEPADFTVVVSGMSVHSGRVTEVVTFAAGDTTKTTNSAFTDITSIANRAPHLNDVTVTDLDGNVLAVLGNRERLTDYKIVQVVDYMVTSPQNPYVVEILYKIRFTPMFNDDDEFCCPGYDDCIFYKTMEALYAKKDLAKAEAAAGKAAQILRQIADDNEQAIMKEAEFLENPSQYPFNRMRNFRGQGLFPGAYPANYTGP